MAAKSEKITLKNGLEVYRDAEGRCRDVRTGRWVSAADLGKGHSSAGEGGTPRNLLEQAVSQAARNQGYLVENVDEAVGRLIQVQAEIALDRDDPAKATSAARLLDKLTGLFSEADTEEDPDQPWFVLGRELAIEVLALVEEEQARREHCE